MNFIMAYITIYNGQVSIDLPHIVAVESNFSTGCALN